MEQTFTTLGLLFFLAAFNESMVEFIFSNAISEMLKKIHYLIPMATGLLLALVFQVDLLKAIPGDIMPSSYPAIASWIMSGLVIGRGSRWVHDYMGQWGSNINGKVEDTV